MLNDLYSSGLVAPKEEEALRKLFAEMEKGRLNEKSRTLEGDILTALSSLEEKVKNSKLPPSGWWKN